MNCRGDQLTTSRAPKTREKHIQGAAASPAFQPRSDGRLSLYTSSHRVVAAATMTMVGHRLRYHHDDARPGGAILRRGPGSGCRTPPLTSARRPARSAVQERADLRGHGSDCDPAAATARTPARGGIAERIGEEEPPPVR